MISASELKGRNTNTITKLQQDHQQHDQPVDLTLDLSELQERIAGVGLDTWA